MVSLPNIRGTVTGGSMNNQYKKDKLKALKLFKSQSNKSYFQKPTLDSFHSNFQCSKKGIKVVEQFKIIELTKGKSSDHPISHS